MSPASYRSALNDRYQHILPACIVVSTLAEQDRRSAGCAAPTVQEDRSFSLPVVTRVPLDGGGDFVAQVFTAGTTGILSAVCVDVDSSSKEPLHVAIHEVTNGLPNGNILGERYLWSAMLEPIASSSLDQQIDLALDIPVRAGAQYAIVLDYGTYQGADCRHGTWGGAPARGEDGGGAYATRDRTFQSWTPVGPGDVRLRYRTFVQPALPVPDVSIAWVSRARHAKFCEVFSETFQLRNMSSRPIENLFLTLGGADQFDFVNVDGTPGPVSAPITLAPWESRPVSVYVQVTVPAPSESGEPPLSAESRDGWAPSIVLELHGSNGETGALPCLISKRRTSLLP